jgi:hypothetical protein
MKNNYYNLNDEPNLPLNNNDKNSFGLPAHYFESFEDKLRKKLESQEELNEFALLSSIPKNNLFATPTDYFATTENTLEMIVELGTYTQLQSVKPLVGVELDEEYINRLQSAIKYKVELAEELKVYEKLYAIDKVNPFIASEAYFEGISERVKDRIYNLKDTKVSVLDRVLDFIFRKKMAFAFGLVIIISLSGYFYNSLEKSLETGDCKTLACLERQDILNDNNVISNFDEEQLMDLVDVNKLHQQLNYKKEKSATTNRQLNLDSINQDDLLDAL